MPCRLTLLLLFAVLWNIGNAQSDTLDTPAHQLLWELTGPASSSPSYIFGSMHVREPDAFVFPDSMWHCIQSVDAFANEVHLDSAVLRAIEIYLGGAPSHVDSSYIRLTDSIRVTADFMTNFEAPGTNTAKATASRPSEVETSDINFPTFMDAYLMEYAKRQGKTLYGLEKIDHHLHDVDLSGSRSFSLFGPSKESLEKMYFAGDIMSIGELISKQPTHFDRLALVARNYIMANSIEQILEEESSVFAVVGAAHLPGNTGLLALMEERGYNLRPVTVTFENDPVDWTKDLPIRNWQAVQGQRQLFEAKLPTPFVYSGNTQLGEQFLNFDIGRGLTFLVMTNRMRPYDHSGFDYGFFELDGFEIDDKELIEVGKLKGHRYELSKPGTDIENYIGYVFFKDQQMYYLQVGAYEAEALKVFEADETELLESLVTPVLHPGKWVKVEDQDVGFTTSLPEYYLRTEANATPETYQEIELGDNMNIYHAGLGREKVTAWVVYADVPTSNWSPNNDSLRLAEGISWVSDYFALDRVADKVWDLGNVNPKVEFEGSFDEFNVGMTAKILLRGNRIFAVLSIDTPDGKKTQKLRRDFALPRMF